MVLNTPSYGGGSDLWDESRGAPLSARTDRYVNRPPVRSSMGDGILEVVGVTDVVPRPRSAACRIACGCAKGSGSAWPARRAACRCRLMESRATLSRQARWARSRLISTSRRRARRCCSRGGAEGGGVSAFAAVEGQLSEEAISTGQRDALLNALGGA